MRVSECAKARKSQEKSGIPGAERQISGFFSLSFLRDGVFCLGGTCACTCKRREQASHMGKKLKVGKNLADANCARIKIPQEVKLSEG